MYQIVLLPTNSKNLFDYITTIYKNKIYQIWYLKDKEL